MCPPRVALLGAGLALVVWCGWVSGFHRSSGAAELTWVVSLVVVAASAAAFWRGRRGRRVGLDLGTAEDPWPRRGRGGAWPALRGVAPWLVVIVVGAAWDSLGIDTGPNEAHLTISALAQSSRPLNALLLLVWMLVGIGYAAARARAPRAADEAAPAVPGGQTDRIPPGATWAVVAVPAGHRAIAPALLLPSSRPAGVVFWLALLVLAVAVDVVARRSTGRVATAEEFARFISTAWPANVALTAAWAFAGYHLFAR